MASYKHINIFHNSSNYINNLLVSINSFLNILLELLNKFNNFTKHIFGILGCSKINGKNKNLLKPIFYKLNELSNSVMFTCDKFSTHRDVRHAGLLLSLITCARSEIVNSAM